MLQQIASQYFAFLAERFPVMCASDEFHFLPRAGAAAEYSDRLDNLGSGSIQDAITELKRFKSRFAELRSSAGFDLEERNDLELLVANINGFLVEFEVKEAYRSNPLLYLKIAFIGLDHALNKTSGSREEMIARTKKRMDAIPTLLWQGIENLSRIPASLLEPSIAMAADSRDYLNDCESALSKGRERKPVSSGTFRKAYEALNDFMDFLISIEPVPDSHFAADTLESSLRLHFQYQGSLEDIFTIAVEDWNWNLEKLEETAAEIDPGLGWQELYDRISPPDMGHIGIIARYRRESERINKFFTDNDLLDISACSGLVIEETPCYLGSVRGSASFAASLNAGDGETDYFYITVGRAEQDKTAAARRYAARLHREYRFLTAHETIPGHFLLDSIRRNLENPVRRQIESPLFYEGWASYAETLLTDYEYVIEPEDRLVDHRRRLWRAARCQIDVGIVTGKLDVEECVNLLESVGFTRGEACGQIDRFRLYPGYQLCYCLGSYEIRKLADKHKSRLGSKKFHNFLLKGGELPFQVIDQRLQEME